MEQLKKLFLSLFALLTCTVMYAQSEISGTVVDASGETVIGATVMEKGTSNGTITDFDGNFTIKVNEGAILVIRYLVHWLSDTGSRCPSGYESDTQG